MAEGNAGTIWPHKWSLFYPFVSVDGKKVAGYACTSEIKGLIGSGYETICGIGTFCHEFSHVLGLADLYDTNDAEGGDSPGFRSFSIMCSGNYNNEGRTPPYYCAEERLQVGWMSMPTEITAAGNYSLNSIENNEAYYLPTDVEDEYYVFESRQGQGWDAYIPTGMMIYHIDKSNNLIEGVTADALWWSNGPNNYTAHQCMDLIESGGEENVNWGETNALFPGTDNVTSFTAETDPAGLSWSGTPLAFKITDISNSSGVSFTVSDNAASLTTVNGTVKNEDGFPLANIPVQISSLESQGEGVRVSADGGAAMCSMIFNVAQGATTTVRTDANGEFSVKREKNTKITIVIEGVKGYNDYSKTIILKKNTEDINIVLSSTPDKAADLKKHGELATAWGFGANAPVSQGAAVEFSAEELKTHVGKQFDNIFFQIGGSSASRVDVILFFNRKEVFRKTVSSPLFGTLNDVNISADKVIIPADTDIMIAYYIENSDELYSLLFDNDEDSSDLGGFICYGNPNSNTYWNTQQANALISAAISLNDNSIDILGNKISYINSKKKVYQVGDVFRLEVIPYTSFSSIECTFDGVAKNNNDEITLSAAGTYKASATIHYPDGGIETITYEVVVE